MGLSVCSCVVVWLRVWGLDEWGSVYNGVMGLSVWGCVIAWLGVWGLDEWGSVWDCVWGLDSNHYK